MANKRFLNPINLVNLASDPSTASEGDIYYNTTDDVVKVYANSVWVAIGAGGGSAITVSTTAPSSPTTGDAWYKNDTGEFYVYDGSFWVEVNGVIASNSFSTISVSGQSDVVADSNIDTLTLIAGTNVSLETNATNDSITINSAGTYTSVDSITYPDYITFDTTPETVPTATGSIFWDSGDGLPATVLNSNVTIGLGQEQVALVKNATGASIAKGKVVYISGAQGQRPTITLSDADTETTSSKTFGLAAEAIADGAEGFVTTFGVLRGVNTDGLTQGAALWLSSTAGNYTTSIPAEPAHSVFIGYVVKAHATAGEIFVNIQNGYELTELHGVVIENNGSVADNEVLAYDDVSGLWKNQTAVEAGLIDTSATEQTKAGNLIIGGNLTVNGTTTTFNTENVLVEDNIITLNSTVTGTPSTDSGIEIERGTSSNVSLLWNETSEEWTLTNDGTNYYPVSTQNGYTYDSVITIRSYDGITDGSINLEAYQNKIQLNDDNGVVITTGAGTDVFSFNNSGALVFPDASSQSTAFLGISSYDTDDITEGATNEYFTDARARTALSADLGGTNGGIRIIAPSNTADATLSNDSATHQVIVGPSGNGTDVKGTLSVVASPSISDPGNLTVAGYIDSTGSITGSSIIKDGGTSSEFLKADGSVDTSTYLTTSTAASTYQPIGSYASDTHNHTLNSLSNVVITGTPTDGQAIVWDTATSKWVNETVSGGGASYPTQTGNNGKFLQTDGSDVSWQNVDLTNYVTLNGAETITGNKTFKGIVNVYPSTGTPLTNIGIGRIEYNDMSDWLQISAYKSSGDNGGRIKIYADKDIVLNSGTSEIYLGDHTSNGNKIAKLSDLTLETITDGGATSSNAISITNTTASTSTSTGALVISGGLGVGDSVWIEGDLHVAGTTVTENTKTVATHDNLIYLNAAQDAVITNAVGNGTYVTYTADNNYTVGMDIRVTGMNPSGYDISSADGLTVYSATSTQFVVAKTTTGSFVSGGTAHAKEEANPDLGFAGGYYSGGYAHAGLFRDASDGVFKFFQGYTPEPDEAVNIDTTHASFALANISIKGITLLDTTSSIGIGYLSGNFSGDSNYAFGQETLDSNIGGGNYGIGWLTLAFNTGAENYGIGKSALKDNIGNTNYAFGDLAGRDNTGSDNLFLGHEAGTKGTSVNSGNYNVYIGKTDGLSTNNNIVIADNEGNLRAQYLSADFGWTLGTIYSATWNGSAIDYQYGGTGLTSLGTAGQVLTVNSGATGLEWATPSSGGGPSTTTTSITVNTAVAIESFDKTVSRTAEAIIQITQGTDYYSSKVLLIHNGTTVKITEYAILESTVGAIPVTISSAISGSNVELRATITDAATTNATAKVIMTEVAV